MSRFLSRLTVPLSMRTRATPYLSSQSVYLPSSLLSIHPLSINSPLRCYSAKTNMSSQRRKPVVERWSLYPRLHGKVARLLKEEGLKFKFYNVDNDIDDIDERDTNIMGRFKCHNRGCSSSGWSSKKIAITIRMYPGDKYNARVYHQRCKSCNNLSRPVLDESYAERVTYWIKKWNGVEVERPDISGESNSPHNSQLCEGCKAGHCNEFVDDWEVSFRSIFILYSTNRPFRLIERISFTLAVYYNWCNEFSYRRQLTNWSWDSRVPIMNPFCCCHVFIRPSLNYTVCDSNCCVSFTDFISSIIGEWKSSSPPQEPIL